jgi:predicted GNAT superfamily acetyltransferase
MIEVAAIRPITSLQEIRQVETLQREVWRFATDAETVPLHMLKATAENGGLLWGAFSAQGDLLGFVMGFLARQDGQLKHYSHMLGVLPTAQGAGVGFRLKCAQREAVLAQGIDRITWTVDPLEGRNGHLNMGKLGTVCNTYHRNWYGELFDGLNAGMPTDRFQVDWWLRSQRVERRTKGESTSPSLSDVLANGARRVNETRRSGAVRVPSGSDLGSTSPMVLVEIPGDFQEVKQADMQAALHWRMHTRELFESYFRAGYTVTEFVGELTAQGRRSFYLLERDLIPEH